MGDISPTPSPTKRRRTRGLIASKNIKSIKSTLGRDNLSPCKLKWPPRLVPVEIFGLITSYLPRSNIQNMRLVNKEFDKKVSEVLFRIVVVPFRPEIYGITPETTSSNDEVQQSIMIQDQGMRVFQGFGNWIQRFAMSFEIDYFKLSSPPLKCEQEAITSFWGIYRWPFKSYNRYSALEGLEQTADETRTMAKALQFISNAKELGLSIDGGLGWLAGPDISQRVAERGGKLPVFGASKFMPETSRHRKKARQPLKLFPPVEPEPEPHSAMLTRILEQSGYTGEHLQSAMKLLQENEGEEILEDIDIELQAINDVTWDGLRANLETPASGIRRYPDLQRRGGLTANILSQADEEDFEDDADSISNQPSMWAADGTQPGNGGFRRTAKNRRDSLKPNDLTNAQREMLLEMEWAQNAFIHSWVIAIMDNQNRQTFKNLEAITIARIPTRHLAALRRKDFWDSIPQLKSFSLAVIPDWREVKKEPTSWVQDTKVAPSNSVTAVFDIINQQISRRKNISALHFEWLCGGEYAPGMFSRNQNILAAPVVATAMHMVNRAQERAVLALPHIEHLSLKNCWLSPHILSKLLLPMRKQVLQSISFDSVSLTATLPRYAEPNPITEAAAVHVFQGALVPVMAPLVPPNATQENDQPDWLDPPRIGSWTEIIDKLSPGTTLAELRYSRDQDRDLISKPEAREETKLTKLAFKSCGYVRVPLDFDQSVLEPAQPLPQASATLNQRYNELDPYMMKPLEAHTMATIINYVDPVESVVLENAWNMIVGWRTSPTSYSEQLVEAMLDGIPNAGDGRFDGCIETA
ncbi:hypothetical protein LZ554_006786 [Drepanopeziza brunnea f. sp. 'monogermtubi']|nr:hypothetical protein LZ554_006786 [Drepanopeziza brunnea f. sp. 'monogermtubi']